MIQTALRATILWLILLVIVCLTFVVMVMQSRPSRAEVAAALRPLSPLPTEGLSDQALQTLTARDLNGTLPVEAVPADPPRSDPFL